MLNVVLTHIQYQLEKGQFWEESHMKVKFAYVNAYKLSVFLIDDTLKSALLKIFILLLG